MKMKSSGKQVQTYQYLKSIPNEIIPNKYSHCAKEKMLCRSFIKSIRNYRQLLPMKSVILASVAIFFFNSLANLNSQFLIHCDVSAIK